MKLRFLLVIFLMGSFPNYSISQYLKLKEDFTFEKDEIKFTLLKSEIYPLIYEDVKSYLIFANDTFPIEPDNFDTISTIDTSYNDIKNDIIKKINEKFYLVDVSSIKDTLDIKTYTIIKIYSDKNILITSFTDPGTDSISINECGDFFRVVRLNANIPVLIYNKGSLDSIYRKNITDIVIKLLEDEKVDVANASVEYIKKYALNRQIILSDNEAQAISITYGYKEKNMIVKFITSNYIYIIIGALVIIGALILYFNFYRIKSVKKITYKGSSITKLCKKYRITIIELYELNKEYSDLKGYNNQTKEKRDEIKQKLKGKEFIVDKNLLLPEETHVPKQESYTTKDFSGVMAMLQTIEYKIDKFGGNKEVEVLKAQNIELEKEKSQLDEKYVKQIERLKNENDEKHKQIEAFETSLKDLENRLESKTEGFNKISEEVYRADYLGNIAKNVMEYLDLLYSAENKVKEYYERSIKVDPESKESELLSQMLLHYYLSIPEREIGKWVLIFEKIKNERIITDKELIKRLKEFSEDQQKEISYINRLFFKKVLENYIGNLLILCEEVKNLSVFSGKKSEFSSETESIFRNLIRDILLRTKDPMNLEVNYAPLFDNYKEYPFTRLTDKESRSIYLKLDLPKGHIREVISYGFKKVNGFETEETKITI